VKILILSQFFTPEPFFKGLPFARALAGRGHQVEVLTGFPNYPGGRIYRGYRMRLWQRETMEGLRVNRVALFPSHDSSPFRRILNYTSFALSAAALGLFLADPPDVVYVYHPPPTSGFPAAILSAVWRVPFVYDIQDLWPDSVAATGMLSNGAALRAISKWCSFVYRRAAHIVVLSPGFRRALIERGVPGEKITAIPNWCDEDASRVVDFDEVLARDLGLSGRFNILFAGTMGKAQQLDAVLDAAAVCAARDPRIQFVFVGGGTDRTRLEGRSHGMNNVVFLPYRSPGEMPALLALADALLVHLKADPLFEITIPSKTQSCLAAGKPILMAVAGDAADLVRAAGAGVFAAPGDAKEIAEAALQLASFAPERLIEMGSAGRGFYFRELSLDRGVGRFEEVFAQAKAPATQES
jgi:glycosyltransferase involved in cell wall biosynthesis